MRKNTTGLDDAQIEFLVDSISARVAWDPRRKLSLERSVVLVLQALRFNMPHMLLAFFYEVSQPTVSRIIAKLVPLLEDICRDFVYLPEETTGTALLLDETMIPTGNRVDQPKLYSGKRKKSGMNIQVIASIEGELLAISELVSGSTHDLTAFRDSPFADHLDTPDTICDLGYLGSGMTMPNKKPQKKELTDDRKDVNTFLCRIRARVEHCIGHLKRWKILATGYRGLLSQLPKMVKTIAGLERLRITWSTIQ